MMRLCSSTVTTATGTVYVLLGRLSRKKMVDRRDRTSFPIDSNIMDKFAIGFPKAWDKLVKEFCKAADCEDASALCR